MKKLKKHIGLSLALTSAFLYAFIVIIEKKYVNLVHSELLLFLMYLGSGLGLGIIYLLTKKKAKTTRNKLTKKQIPHIIGIVFCELLASIFIIEALKIVDASVVSLLSVFEMITTAILAYFICKDPLKQEDMLSVVLMVIACIIFNFEDGIFSKIGISSLLVIAGCICWGIENNLTALISSKEPALFTSIKCTSVAILHLIISLIKGTLSFQFPILILYGFLTYGLGILFYAISTKYLGASKSTLIFSISPIFGVILSIIIYKDNLTIPFLISIILMVIALLIMNTKDIDLEEKE